ncbi:unnamed protein product [Didymodactylos carnosus]|uniref:Uncharacterized protein n=1 Tax=Didymodactylos carnosus TaxID=1234261 RepID=A0A813ZMW2_9BILA|nr:unnamed protein product [Didymodactylos carnosus]CAF3683698.1 unnamed protein product [Didymodactylos carnosus]
MTEMFHFLLCASRIILKSLYSSSITLFWLYLISCLLPFVKTLIITKNACELTSLPKECQCQKLRNSMFIQENDNDKLNETRMKCKTLTNVTSNYRWSIVQYDRLSFDSDNLTLHSYTFNNLKVRSLRFNTQYLRISDHVFTNAVIGQLAFSRFNTYGQIIFSNSTSFRGSTTTNIYFKQIDFIQRIPETCFAGAKFQILLIQSSKFYGFINNLQRQHYLSTTTTTTKSTTPSLTTKGINPSLSDDEQQMMFNTTIADISYIPNINSSEIKQVKINSKRDLLGNDIIDENVNINNIIPLPEKTVIINITVLDLQLTLDVYRIIQSIHSSLTFEYFPTNIDYKYTTEIELQNNNITELKDNCFKHLYYFHGRLTLINNRIKIIGQQTFADLLLLRNLSLAKNLIDFNINNDISYFLNLSNLFELDLSYNNIHILNNNTFNGLKHLHILRLSYNPLKYIEIKTFSHLILLKEISLEGIQFVDLIKKNFLWIYNLASVHVINLLNTNFDLGDVAFCILSKFNRTLFHLPRQHPCSCAIHYLYRNHDYFKYTIIPNHPAAKYLDDNNYLRLTPTCIQNYTEEILGKYSNNTRQTTSDLLLKGVGDKCDYELMFINCSALTATTTTITITTTIESTVTFETTSTTITPTSWWFKYTDNPITEKQRKRDNMIKLFTVLATIFAITIFAIILVIIWYRLKAIWKRNKKKKKQQRRMSNVTSSQYNPSGRFDAMTDSRSNSFTADTLANNDMMIINRSGGSGFKTQSQSLISAGVPSPSKKQQHNGTNSYNNNIIYKNQNIIQTPVLSNRQLTSPHSVQVFIDNEESKTIKDNNELQTLEQQSQQQMGNIYYRNMKYDPQIQSSTC